MTETSKDERRSETQPKARNTTAELQLAGADVSLVDVRRCGGCDRYIGRDAMPDKDGTYWVRLVEVVAATPRTPPKVRVLNGAPHDEVACLTAHGPTNGGSSYAGTVAAKEPPKKLPRTRGISSRTKRARAIAERRRVERNLGLIHPDVHTDHREPTETTFCSIAPPCEGPTSTRWV